MMADWARQENAVFLSIALHAARISARFLYALMYRLKSFRCKTVYRALWYKLPYNGRWPGDIKL